MVATVLDNGIRRVSRRWSPSLEILEERCTPTHPVPIPGYSLTDLGTFGGTSIAHAVNHHGQVVGAADYPTLSPLEGVRRAFLWEQGNLNDLGPSSYRHSVAHGLNDLGQAVGWAMDDPLSPRVMLWNTGTGAAADQAIPGRAYGINNYGQIVGEWKGGGGFVLDDRGLVRVPKLDGYETTAAHGINDAGQVVGAGLRAFDEIGQTYLESRAFLWDRDGKMLDLGTLPSQDQSLALAVNGQGQVVGRSGAITCGNVYCDWIASRAFVWQREVGMMDLGDMGFDHLVNAVAHDINEEGQVVGTINGQAFLYEYGSMVDLNMLIARPSIWHLTAATGINDAGQIVGYGEVAGQTRAFLLTPQQVPKVHPLLGVSDAGLHPSNVDVSALTPICVPRGLIIFPPPPGGTRLLSERSLCSLVPTPVEPGSEPVDIRITLTVRRSADYVPFWCGVGLNEEPADVVPPFWCGVGLHLKPADIVQSL